MEPNKQIASGQPSLSSYAKRVAEGVDLPQSASSRFNSDELAVLGAIRDIAYRDAGGACSLSVNEIAQLVEVSSRTASRAITVAIAAGIIERDGNNLFNCGIRYKV
jgi:hypothetical protein